MLRESLERNKEVSPDKITSLPKGILYRKNCEGSLKNVLDVLSLIDGHFFINANLDVNAIYSESKNIAISIASSGEITTPHVNTPAIASIVDLTLTSASGYQIIFDDNVSEESCGTLHMIPEENRPGWVLVAGTDVLFTDVDFSSYVPVGVKALLLSAIMLFTGDGTSNYTLVQVRKKGSSETTDARIRFASSEFKNLPADTRLNHSLQRKVLCDPNGVIQYRLVGGPGSVYMGIDGYYY
jgi:hypothetical protein